MYSASGRGLHPIAEYQTSYEGGQRISHTMSDQMAVDRRVGARQVSQLQHKQDQLLRSHNRDIHSMRLQMLQREGKSFQHSTHGVEDTTRTLGGYGGGMSRSHEGHVYGGQMSSSRSQYMYGGPLASQHGEPKAGMQNVSQYSRYLNEGNTWDGHHPMRTGPGHDVKETHKRNLPWGISNMSHHQQKTSFHGTNIDKYSPRKSNKPDYSPYAPWMRSLSLDSGSVQNSPGGDKRAKDRSRSLSDAETTHAKHRMHWR